MTMHLLPIYYSTSRTKKAYGKRATSIKHEEWIAKITGKKVIDKKFLERQWRDAYATMLKSNATEYKSAGMTGGTTSRPEPKVYTGDKLMGIATMHKSNMVPVFSSQDAEDISRMRRG